MEYSIEIIGFIITLLLTIIGYFLRDSHRGIRSDLKETMEQTAENRANIEMLQVKSDGKLDQLKETTELQIQQLVASIDNMAKVMDSKIEHLNVNLKHGNEGFLSILEEILDKK